MSETPPKNLVNPHPLSWVSVFTTMCFGQNPIADCTSFLYKKDGQIFLVSNWHNFTGRHPDTRKPLPTRHGDVFPNAMEVVFPLSTNPIKWHHFKVNFCKEDLTEPEWFEHPLHGGKVDVGVLPLTWPVTFEDDFPAPPIAISINDFDFSKFTEEIGQEIFILGYPEGIKGGGALPLWKRGSIASEPQVQLDGLPKILVDAATRKGMSGSPVIARKYGIETAAQASGEAIGWVGHQYKFLGVYSGRMFNDSTLLKDLSSTQKYQSEIEAVLFAAQLGIVWKASVIDEIIAAKKHFEI